MITKDQAISIAEEALNNKNYNVIGIEDKLPANATIYFNGPDVPYWYIMFLRNSDCSVLESTYLIIISKLTGNVVFSGSMGDEG